MENKAEILKIDFSDLKNRDVQRNDLDKNKSTKDKLINYSEAIKNVEHSFFRNVYKQALEQIAMIVRQNNNQNPQLDTDSFFQHDIQNIIAFTGRRGTGKTSAMASLVDYLSNHDIKMEETSEKISFKFLAGIDATALDRNVSLIPAILSQIISRLNDELYSVNYGRKNNENERNAIQKIYKTANELFNDYVIGMHTSSQFGDASNYLSITSKRLSFEKSFRDLIKSYSSRVFENDNSYFIICIDDVDMAPCNHAELLVSIHQYLMIPNIIVFLTANIKFLAPEVQTMFYKNATPTYDKASVNRLSNEQTEEYLKKIIPSDNRITLPSWKKKDYISIFPIKVSFYNDLKLKDAKEEMESSYSKLKGSEFFKFIENKDAEGGHFSITPKELILMMIANRTKVYLDVCGMKYHFFEPSSLRNMYDLFYILYNMNNIVEEYDGRKDGNNYYLHRSQNRKRLLDYIHFTMKRDYHFDDMTSEFLDELIAYPLERRGQKIWGYYYQLLDSEGISQRIDSAYGNNFRATEKFFYKAENYSFGEFFRILYTSSRLGVFNHRLIKFILASYSMALPAFVENEKRMYEEEHYKHLADLYGSSLIGTNWCDELFGCKSRITIEKDTTEAKIKYSDPIVSCYEAKRCSILIDVSSENKVDILDIEKLISLLLLSPHWITGKAIEVKKYRKKWQINAELDPTSFLINCLLINDKIRNKYADDVKYTKADLKIFKYKDGKNDNIGFHTLHELIEAIYRECYLSADNYCILKDDEGKYVINRNSNNQLNVKKENDIPVDYKNAYHDSIIKIKKTKEFKIWDCLPIYLRDEKDNLIIEKGKPIKVEKNIVDIILDYLAQDYRAHHLANMLKHIDLIYNTIKRSITDIVYITSHDVIKKKDRFENAGEPVDIIKNFYDNLIDQLRETDKIYFVEGVEASHSFAKRFKESAIVKNVYLIHRTNEKSIELVNHLYEKIEEQANDSPTDKIIVPKQLDEKPGIVLDPPTEGIGTLSQLFDIISSELFSTNVQLEVNLSIFMASLRGHFFVESERNLSIEKAHSINDVVTTCLCELSINYDNNEILNKTLEKAYKEIQAVLDGVEE